MLSVIGGIQGAKESSSHKPFGECVRKPTDAPSCRHAFQAPLGSFSSRNLQASIEKFQSFRDDIIEFLHGVYLDSHAFMHYDLGVGSRLDTL